MALAIFRDTVANPSCMAAKDIFLLKFPHGKSLLIGFINLKTSEMALAIFLDRVLQSIFLLKFLF